MIRNLNRRLFLKRAAVAASALSAARFLPGPNILQAASSPDKIRYVQIGCGGRAMEHFKQVAETQKQNLVGIVDVMEGQNAVVHKWMKSKSLDDSQLQFFTDYRKMFDTTGKQIDAVFITAPNHHHAPAAKIAMQ